MPRGFSIYKLGFLSLVVAAVITHLLPWLGVFQYQAREEARAAALTAGLAAVEAAEYDKAVPLLRPSAERGDQRAIVKLAEAIAFDTKQDVDEETLWFPKAAAIDPNAVFQIATKLETTSWGLENTIDLYAAASRNGSQGAQSRLGQIYQGAQLAFEKDDKEKGLEFATLLARTGEFWPQSHDLLVEHLYTMEGHRDDFFEALGSVYDRAKSGDRYAALDLGRTFSMTPLVKGAVRDHQLAVGWLQIAAQGVQLEPEDAATAMYWLGVEYHRCDNACRDDERALLWFKLAAAACDKIGTDDISPPCDGARGASLMLTSQLDETRRNRVDQIVLEWTKGNKAAAFAPIPAELLHPEPLMALNKETMTNGGSSDQFAVLGSFNGLDEARLHLWIARNMEGAPLDPARSVLECSGNTKPYSALVGPSSTTDLKQVCRSAKAPSCIRVTRSQLVSNCSDAAS
jgi:TPR repeat protein